MKLLIRYGWIICLSCLLSACAAHRLEQGKTSFVQQDYGTAFKNLEPLARKGMPDAEYAVGYMYYYGKGVAEDQIVGENWIRKAAAHGQPEAVQAAGMFDRRVRKGLTDPIQTLN